MPVYQNSITMNMQTQALPPSPFAKRRQHELNGRKGSERDGIVKGHAVNGGLGGREEMRSRTAGKVSGGNESAGDEVMHRSAIEQLQGLDVPVMEHPMKTEQLINIKRTFDQLQIRKSSSFDKDRIDLSLSSDYVDFLSENTVLKKKIEDLENSNARLVQAETAARAEVKENRKKLLECEEKLENAEKQCRFAGELITEYERTILEKEEEAAKLKQQMSSISRAVFEHQERSRNSGIDLQALKNHFQNETQSIISAYQQQISTLEAQLQHLSSQFSIAKAVGQQQIGNLLRELQKKQKENIFLRNTINQNLFSNSSTHFSKSITLSKAQNGPIQPSNQKYMTRFQNFANMIDRKLFSSCDDRDSNLFYSKVIANSEIQKRRQGSKLMNLGELQKQEHNQTQYSRHFHHFSANY